MGTLDSLMQWTKLGGSSAASLLIWQHDELFVPDDGPAQLQVLMKRKRMLVLL